MAIKIQKIKIQGKSVYPATILDAIKDGKAKIIVNGIEQNNPNLGKTVRTIIEENAATASAATAAVSTKVGDLSKLSTTAKTNIVAAINEVLSAQGTDAAAIATLQGVVNTLNGSNSTEGSVKKQIKDAIAGIVNNAPEKFDTLKEIADWITNSDDKTAADIVAAVNANTTAIGAKAKGETASTGLYKEIEDAKAEAIAAAKAAEHAKTTVVAGTNGKINVDGADVTVYTHPTATSTVAAAVKVGKDNQGHVVIGDTLAASDISTTAITASDTVVGFTGTTVAAQLSNAATAIKTVANNLANKNVSASGDTYVSASATSNKVTIAATNKLSSAVASAETALQGVTHGIDGSFITLTVGAKDGSNKQAISGAVTSVSTIGTPTAATGLVTDKAVYDYALTCVDTDDSSDYNDVFE